MKRYFLLSGLLIGSLSAAKYTITPDSVSKIKNICKVAKAGDVIYLRGGVYKKHFPIMRCKGSKKGFLTITAYPNEKVTIRSSWVITGDYLNIYGLNFRGYADKLNYKKVISHWWKPSKDMKSKGILIKGAHIKFHDNAVGYYPSSGVKFTGKSDYITISHNIIYNNAWWSTGGTGGLIIKNIVQLDNSSSTKVKIVNNLFFGNESRIFSHVFSKGFAKLVIDEGESFLIQQEDDKSKSGHKKGRYQGRYLVKNNLIFFNGKGTSLNKANRIDFISNALYCNGTTAHSPNAAGVRGNKTNDDIFKNNAVDTCKKGKGFSVSGERNYFQNNYIKSPKDPNISGVVKVDKLFENPAKLDFFNPYFGDKFNKLLSSFKDMLEKYSIEIKPTGYKVDTKKQVEDIIKYIPKNSKTVIKREKDKIIIKNIDNKGIKGLGKNFVLKLGKNY